VERYKELFEKEKTCNVKCYRSS